MRYFLNVFFCILNAFHSNLGFFYGCIMDSIPQIIPFNWYAMCGTWVYSYCFTKYVVFPMGVKGSIKFSGVKSHAHTGNICRSQNVLIFFYVLMEPACGCNCTQYNCIAQITLHFVFLSSLFDIYEILDVIHSICVITELIKTDKKHHMLK